MMVSLIILNLLQLLIIKNHQNLNHHLIPLIFIFIDVDFIRQPQYFIMFTFLIL